MFIPVQSYQADLNPRTNQFRIVVVAQGRQPVQLTIETLDEFTAILTMLSKSNVQIDDQTLDLQLALRPVGT